MSLSFKEDFLHYIWKFQKYEHTNLNTEQGKKITIINPGIHNHDAGPDFLNARIKIDQNLWAGSIEIHKHSSEWKQHKHHLDPAYENVILHVVFFDDKPVKYNNDKLIPCLTLNNRINKKTIAQYQNLLFNPNWIACANQIKKVNPITKSMWLTRMATERLEEKINRISPLLDGLGNDWDQLSYYLIAQYFGLKVNNEAFRRLIESTSFDILLKHQDSLFHLEALLLGQANLLINANDNYSQKLTKEYAFLQKKYGLIKMLSHEWKFSRMRPTNFPGLRIAQLAALIKKEGRIFRKIITATSLDELRKIFASSASDYWDHHYRIGKESTKKKKSIGSKTIDILIINVAIPLIFFYGLKTKDQKYKDKAIYLLESIPPEQNKLTKKWKESNVIAKNAANSQALLYLKKNYCDVYRCLSCSIGNKIMTFDG